MRQAYHAAMLTEAHGRELDMGMGQGDGSRKVLNHAESQEAEEGGGRHDEAGSADYDEYEGREEEEYDDDEEDYYAQRYRYGRSGGDIEGGDDEDMDAEEEEEEEEDAEGVVDEEHLQSLALSAMSLGMDNEELLFNLYFFGQQGASEDQGANVRSSVNTAIEEAVAAHSANNT